MRVNAKDAATVLLDNELDPPKTPKKSLGRMEQCDVRANYEHHSVVDKSG